jgi:hypothetical protein
MDSSSKDGNITAWPRLGLNYWGITKCANTTVKTHLYELEHNTQVIESKHIRIHGYQEINYVTYAEAMSNGLLNFAVTRHPYDRFMSMYNDIILSRPKRAAKAGVKNVSTVNELLNYLEESNLSTVDVHFRTQSSFVPTTNILLIDVTLLRHWPLAIPPITKRRHTSKVKTLSKLNEFQKTRIYKLYQEDFDNFGYLK